MTGKLEAFKVKKKETSSFQMPKFEDFSDNHRKIQEEFDKKIYEIQGILTQLQDTHNSLVSKN